MGTPWFLQSVAADGTRLVHRVRTLPFRIGREAGNDLVVEARGLSRRHAELRALDERSLLLADLGSTNGTFVNRERLTGPRAVGENDILHFGNAEYRLTHEASLHAQPPDEADDPDRTMRVLQHDRELSRHFVRQERPFLEFLGGQGMADAAQPIVDMHSGALFAYELLGRCTHPELPGSPVHLFSLAAMLHREAELSEAFRVHGLMALAAKARGARVFVNAHPSETFSEAFFQSLQRLVATPGAPALVVEVHESVVVELDRMRELAARLGSLGVAFAYDDFGAGQARLNELAEVPAHFVKFDMALVHHLHEVSERKQRMVRDLVRLVLELGSVPLAEGVELEDEARVCREMGFQLVQGYLTGRPVLVSQM